MNPIQELLRAYEKQRLKNQDALNERKVIAYERIPQLKAIDAELSLIGVELAKQVFSNPNSAEVAIAKIETLAKKLKREKVILLTDHNLPVDYLDLQYKCKTCKDTGFNEQGKRCRCFEKQLIAKAYDQSAIASKLKRENFANFNLELFSATSPAPGEPSPRELMAENLSASKQFIAKVKRKPAENLCFYGHTGLGKTFLCSCIAKELLDKNVHVVYQTAFQLMDTISRYKFSDKQDLLLREAYELIFNVDVLIIDDLGTEMVNSFTQTEAFNVINSRLLNDKPTIISTNLTPIEITQVYGERLGSRILGHYDILLFTGQDLRLN